MSSLQSKIEALAETFAAGVLAAVRSSSLAEVLGGGDGSGGAAPKRGPGRPKKDSTPASVAVPAPKKAKRGKGGRLLRRSASDIEHVIGLVVAKLGEHKAGLRSEQLQKALKIDKKEISRPLEMALKAKKIVKTGKKRSTTYFAK
jgi:hypothetical protein